MPSNTGRLHQMKREVDSIGSKTSVRPTTNNPVSIKRFGDRHSEVHFNFIFDNIPVLRAFSWFLGKLAHSLVVGTKKRIKLPNLHFSPTIMVSYPFFLVPSVRMVSWWRHGSIPVISLLFLGLDLRSPDFDCFCSGVLVSAPRLYFLYLGRVRVNGAAHLCDAL